MAAEGLVASVPEPDMRNGGNLARTDSEHPGCLTAPVAQPPRRHILIREGKQGQRDMPEGFSGFPAASQQFLAELAANNRREWFQERRPCSVGWYRCKRVR